MDTRLDTRRPIDTHCGHPQAAAKPLYVDTRRPQQNRCPMHEVTQNTEHAKGPGTVYHYMYDFIIIPYRTIPYLQK